MSTYLERLAKSIKLNGQTVPIIMLKNGIILDGNTRLAIAREKGLKTIPAVILDLPIVRGSHQRSWCYGHRLEGLAFWQERRSMKHVPRI